MLQIVLPSILKAFRRVRGLTQEAAAELAKVSTLTWGRWENGKHAPNGNQFEDLARALGQTPLELNARLAEALHRHFAAQKVAAEHEEGGASGASRALLDVVCADLSRATVNLELIARQAALNGDAVVVARLSVSMDEARAALDRVYAIFAAAAGAAATREPDEG